nr:hypothetical protein [Amycolatopsis sp.]
MRPRFQQSRALAVFDAADAEQGRDVGFLDGAFSGEHAGDVALGPAELASDLQAGEFGLFQDASEFFAELAAADGRFVLGHSVKPPERSYLRTRWNPRSPRTLVSILAD